MLKWNSLVRLPICFSFVTAGPGLSAGQPNADTLNNLILRFENARVVNNGACSFNNRTDGLSTTCTRTGPGVTKLTFLFPWPAVPNCTATSESMTNPIISIMPTVNDLTVTTASFSTVLGLLSLGNGDANYSVRCSAGQNLVN